MCHCIINNLFNDIYFIGSLIAIGGIIFIGIVCFISVIVVAILSAVAVAFWIIQQIRILLYSRHFMCSNTVDGTNYIEEKTD